MKRIQKRLLSIVFCVALVFTMFSGVTIKTYAAELNPAAIRLDANNSFGMLGTGKNWVYFGRYGGSPNKWRILSTSKSDSYYYDNAGSNYIGNILFLMSESLMGSVKFSTDGSSNIYQGSNLQAYCNTLYGNCFSSDEQAAILSTSKSTTYDPAVEFWGSSTLDKDKLFSLSLSEVTNSSYGFKSGAFNLSDTARGLNQIWELRTPSTGTSAIAAVVITDGSMTNGAVDALYNVRPAFNMNLTPVLFASAAQGGKPTSGIDGNLTLVPGTAPTEWKLTLQDKSRTFSATPSSATVDAGGTLSVNYSSATSGSNEYVSAILTDAAGNALYYGRLKNIADSSSADGTVNIVIPSDLTGGSYNLKMFSEQYNGDYQTDFASTFSNVALTVTTETTPPTVQSVSPASGTGMNPASLSINFSEVMDTAIAGTVTLNNGATASSPMWSTDKKTLTYTISGLTYSTTYNISISGFSDKVGNIMTTDTSHNYVTEALKYLDENRAPKTATATKIANSTTSLTTGWYVVDSNVTKNGTLTVTGDVKLILVDGCTLTVNGSSNNAGVSVTSGNSLTIYGQLAGTGRLIAYGYGGGAGIGGRSTVNGGSITINGGTVDATGTLYISSGDDGGAGIGGGYGSSGGIIIINGGTVNAKSSGRLGGAGIGSGFNNSSNTGSVTINGGTVTANGGPGGSAGIGGGYRGNGGTITITGGTVTASGSYDISYGTYVYAKGIGGGVKNNAVKPGGVIDGDGLVADGGTVTITGGSVNASIQSTPTNGTANGNTEVKLTKVQLTSVSTAVGVTALTFQTAYSYGTKDLRTNVTGNLYLYLPSGVSVKSADTGSTVYWGLITAGTMDGTLSEDSSTPVVQSITPTGANIAIGTTALSITFSEAIDTETAGTVTLDNGAVISSPQWSSNCKTVTYSLSGLGYNKTYTATVSDFKDIAGHSMTPYIGTFTTAAEFSGGSSTVGSSPEGSGTSYQAEVSGNSTSSGKIPVSIDTNTHCATADIGTEQTATLTGGGNMILSMPSAMDAQSYSVKLPVSSLTATDEKGSLTLKSDKGTVTIPSNMLTTLTGSSEKTAQITIGHADTSGLPNTLKNFIGDRPVVQLTLDVDGKQTAWNNPDAPVTISIPYKPSAQEQNDPNGIVVWYIDGSGKLVCMPDGRYNAATGTVTFTTTHFSLYTVGYNAVRFNDVAENVWYSDAVYFLAARNIASGTGNGNYGPHEKLTRGEFIVMLMRAYGITENTNTADNYTDAGNTYYTGYLAAAKRLGISNGVGNNLFAPEKQITRQEMFTLLYNALKVIDKLPKGNSGKALSDFSDEGKIASWAKDAIALLVKTGTIGGSYGKLCPTDTMTRAEMAQVLYNLMSR